MKKTLIATGLLFIPAALLARWNDCWSGGFMQGRGSWFGGNFFGGGIFMLITTLVLLGFLGFFAYGYIKNKNIMDGKAESAFDIAALRYAKGEISKEEFETIKADIT
jgi:putative membrane protein